MVGKQKNIIQMTKEEKKDKLTAMNALNIPAARRGAFIRWANNWGRFNLYCDWKWYEYSPLEARSKATKTMQEMWDAYLQNCKYKTLQHE